MIRGADFFPGGDVMTERHAEVRSGWIKRGAVLRAIGVSALILLGAAIIQADSVLDWNVIALNTTAAAPFNPPLESRNLAIAHAAMFDAVNSIVGEFRSTRSSSPHPTELRPMPPLRPLRITY
jgi:hypothetical protein